MPFEPPLSEQTVLAVDNVPLELPIARVGSRVLAAVLDYLLLTAIGVAAGLAGVAIGIGLSLRPGWIFGLILIGWFLLEHGYFMGSEILLGGQTPGKKVFRLQVVAADGSRAAASALVVRNVLRTLDLFVGVILMALDPLARRVGDRLGGTRVVHRSRLRAPSETLAFPSDWRPEEIRLVESFFTRVDELDPAPRGRVARRLERFVESRAPGLLPATAGEPTERLRAAFRQGLLPRDRG